MLATRDGVRLVLEKDAGQRLRDVVVAESLPRIPCELVGELQVDKVRLGLELRYPRLLDQLDEVLVDRERTGALPLVLEPIVKLFRRVLVEDVDVEFALIDEAREREVARPTNAFRGATSDLDAPG